MTMRHRHLSPQFPFRGNGQQYTGCVLDPFNLKYKLNAMTVPLSHLLKSL